MSKETIVSAAIAAMKKTDEKEAVAVMKQAIT